MPPLPVILGPSLCRVQLDPIITAITHLLQAGLVSRNPVSMIFHHAITRRGLLAGVAAAAFAPGVTGSAARAASVGSGLHLLVERRTIEVDGRAASVFGIRQPDGTAGLVVDPGQPFSTTVDNRCGEATIIHWHGQTPPFLLDGVAETGGVITEPGTTEAYSFPARPGTHWMHSHLGLQE